MKELLIHIGYPKTATTTLQESLLVPLHRTGVINYLGRADFTSDSGLKSTFEKIHGTALGTNFIQTQSCLPLDAHVKHEAVNHDRNIYNTMPQGSFSAFLANDKLNVYSDEALLLPYRSLTGHRTLPGRLKSMFDDGNTNIKILITIRSQADLMNSFFAEKYGYFRSLPDYETPTALFFKDGLIKSGEHSEIFDFEGISANYASIFEENNVGILVYEDIKNNKEDFILTLSNVMMIDSAVCDSLFGKINFRNKERIGEHYAVRSNRYRALASLFSSQQGNPFYSMVNHTIRLSPGLKAIAKRMLGKSQCSLPIPVMSYHEKNTVFNYYKTGNMEIAGKFGLNPTRLASYGYF